MGFLVWVICCFIPFSQRIAIFLLVDWWRHWLSWGSSIPGGLRDNGRSDDVSFKRVFRQGHSFPRFWFSDKKSKWYFDISATVTNYAIEFVDYSISISYVVSNARCGWLNATKFGLVLQYPPKTHRWFVIPWW